MHIAKKEEELHKINSRYSDLFLVVAVQTPPRKHQNSIFSNSDASKKETVHKHHRHLIIDQGFHPGESPHSQRNGFNKVFSRHNQLRPDLEFSPSKVGL
jgi:hypothetical protein